MCVLLCHLKLNNWDWCFSQYSLHSNWFRITTWSAVMEFEISFNSIYHRNKILRIFEISKKLILLIICTRYILLDSKLYIWKVKFNIIMNLICCPIITYFNYKIRFNLRIFLLFNFQFRKLSRIFNKISCFIYILRNKCFFISYCLEWKLISNLLECIINPVPTFLS